MIERDKEFKEVQIDLRSSYACKNIHHREIDYWGFGRF